MRSAHAAIDDKAALQSCQELLSADQKADQQLSLIHEGNVAPHFANLLRYCSDISNDPNNLEDEIYILRLIKQVITVSLETVDIVKGLPGMEMIEESEIR